jgi:hypothetical protein
MDADDRLRLDYATTTDRLRTLTDVRFKLLAFVPTIAGTAVGFLRHPGSAAELLAVGLLGLVATFGVLLYELRNSELAEYLGARAAALERELALKSVFGGDAPGGPFGERPPRTVRLFGVVPPGNERGLSLVYSAAVAGWSYLVAWGALRALDVGHPRTAGAVIGVVAGLVVLADIERLGRQLATG